MTTTARTPVATDRVTQYAQDVVAGRVVAGNLVIRACQRHLDDLERGEGRGLWFDVDAAGRAISFFSCLKQHKGRWANQPLHLQDWQSFVVGSIFGWKQGDLRRFRNAYVEVARKNGKSTLAAGIGLYLLDFDGEPGAEIYAAATKRDQAKIVWTEAAEMVKRVPSLRRRILTTPSRSNLHVVETVSKFEALGADNNTLSGLNVHGAIIDELHEHKTRDVVDILETASGAREQPLFFYITTAGITRESIYQEIHGYARRIAESTVEDDQWFVYVATLDPKDDWRDVTLYAKPNPSLGVTVQLDELVAERDRAVEVPGRQNTFRRFRLNQQTEQVSRWIDIALWDKGAEPFDEDDLRGRRCFGGLDLAKTRDLSALALLFPPVAEGERWKVVMRYWCPEDDIHERSRRDGVPYDQWAQEGYITATPGNFTDYDFIEREIYDLAGKFDIVEICFDRMFHGQLITHLTDEGLEMVEFGQGFYQLAAPTAELERLLLAERFQHGGHPILRWNALNVSVAHDSAGNMKPDKKDAERNRIDGIAAVIDALGGVVNHEEQLTEITGEAFWL